MSRKAGTPNKPKEQSIDCYHATATITNNELTNDEDVIQDYKYRVITFYNLIEFEKIINEWIKCGYECQGGVSVTNYRANDGSIVMVYVQAMVKREG